MMSARNFDEATVVLSALNYLWALRICQQSKNKAKLFVNWVYCISILSISIVTIIFTEIVERHDYEQRMQLKDSTHLYVIVFYVIMITWVVVLGWCHSKVRKFINIKVCRCET